MTVPNTQQEGKIMIEQAIEIFRLIYLWGGGVFIVLSLINSCLPGGILNAFFKGLLGS